MVFGVSQGRLDDPQRRVDSITLGVDNPTMIRKQSAQSGAA